MMILRSFLFLAAVLEVEASANAFNINEHDAKVTGRGGATAASNDGPSSIVFNPGGIAISEGTTIAIGGSLYMAEGSYEAEGATKTTTDSAPSVVPNLYVTSKIAKRVAVGIGFHLPFGLAVSWPDGHAQSNVIQDQSLRTFFISPVIGVNLLPGLSIGGGIDVVPATIELESRISFGDTVGTAHLGGNTVGLGGRAGLMYHPPSLRGRLKIGAMYRSPVKLDFKGDGDFDIAEPFGNQLPDDGPISAAITLPQSVAGGIAVSPVKNVELEVNAIWINWSKAYENNELSIELPNGSIQKSPQNYKDTLSLRFGIEGRPTKDFALRAGFVYDPTPIPASTLSARLPDIDRRSLTVGGSSYLGGFGLHLAALWVLPGSRESADSTAYSVAAFVVSAGVSTQFGGSPRSTRAANQRISSAAQTSR